MLATELLSGFTFYSLVGALIYNKWGIINISPSQIGGHDVLGGFYTDVAAAIEKVIELLNDLDQKREDGTNVDFVKAGLKTTHSVTNRIIRLRYFVGALQER